MALLRKRTERVVLSIIFTCVFALGKEDASGCLWNKWLLGSVRLEGVCVWVWMVVVRKEPPHRALLWSFVFHRLLGLGSLERHLTLVEQFLILWFSFFDLLFLVHCFGRCRAWWVQKSPPHLGLFSYMRGGCFLVCSFSSFVGRKWCSGFGISVQDAFFSCNLRSCYQRDSFEYLCHFYVLWFVFFVCLSSRNLLCFLFVEIVVAWSFLSALQWSGPGSVVLLDSMFFCVVFFFPLG